ncbi:hypothetical protein DY000_02022765 [Brassica cretica]|uniref:Uncharacterized protein n=1 Tax=Brassica cretica TaxID=69181 RepID=A0ABQ7E6Z4_BRACR|nr:hypothetical protein DY000_02022765 [Brassica cretica]
MSSSNYFRSWIDRPHLDPNTRLLTEEYQRGITEFMGLVHRQPEAKTDREDVFERRKAYLLIPAYHRLAEDNFTLKYKSWLKEEFKGRDQNPTNGIVTLTTSAFGRRRRKNMINPHGLRGLGHLLLGWVI